MKNKALYHHLDDIFSNSPLFIPKKKDKVVVFSDLHMGNGASSDDFKRNADLLINVLDQYYASKQFSLILNGDVEDLQRFSLASIRKQWQNLYDIFDKFNAAGRLFKILGNHDEDLANEMDESYTYKPLQSLRILLSHGEMFLLHGHQVSQKYLNLNKLVGYILRYIATPLRIKNYSVAHDSRKKFAIEQKVYNYAKYKQIVSIIGHTHRPLFESLTKAERLKHQIEELCRKYAMEKDTLKLKEVKKIIKSHKKELRKIHKKNKKNPYETQLYSNLLHVPCLFNSGCVIGKRGITCIEFDHEEIRLVHWFDKRISSKYLTKRGYEPEQLGDTNYYRMILNNDKLDYIYTRINLLT